MFFRRRCQNLLPLFLLVGGILVSIFIMKKMKDLYDGNQKFHRIQTYKEYMKEISDLLTAVAKSANRSAENLHLLNTALQQNLEPRATKKAVHTRNDTR